MNLKETLRYLGYRGKEADEQTLKLIGECWEELEEKTQRRACFREFPLVFLEDRIDMGCLQQRAGTLGKIWRDAAWWCCLRSPWGSWRTI